MSAEQLLGLPEDEPLVYQPPGINIDEDAPDEIRKQLELDILWLQRRPLKRVEELRSVDNPHATDISPVWNRLTDRTYCKYFEFDAATELFIDQDDIMKQNTKESKAVRSDDAAQAVALARRKRRLEIFLERYSTTRSIGMHSIQIQN